MISNIDYINYSSKIENVNDYNLNYYLLFKTPVSTSAYVGDSHSSTLKDKWY